MKQFLLWLSVALFAVTASATPQQISYEGSLANPAGAPLDTTVTVTFKLYSDSTAGALLWTETRPAVTVADGRFNVRLGQVTALTNVILNNVQVWLGVTVGNNSEMTPRSRLVSVPYSYGVGTVEGAAGGTISGKLSVGSGNTNEGSFAMVHGQNNHARGDQSVISGGGGPLPSDSNSTTGSSATIAGGWANAANGNNGVVGGGAHNKAESSYTSVGGGSSNIAAGGYATIGGGGENDVRGAYAIVGGGRNNRSRGDYSFIGGGGGALLSDSNSALGTNATISGGWGNTANGNTSSVGGGGRNHAEASYSAVGGGQNNYARGAHSVVGGGGGGVASTDSNSAGGSNATIAGGWGNTALGNNAAIGGGGSNTAESSYTTVAGGSNNDASAGYATVSGGASNQAVGAYSVIGGGSNNHARGDYAVIGGGGGVTASLDSNSASGDWSFIGSGHSNTASGPSASIVGGSLNIASATAAAVGGGEANGARGANSSVGGGAGNVAFGNYATIPGGAFNRAPGTGSFAAGRYAWANHHGSFVWGSTTLSDSTTSLGDYTFTARCAGGARFITSSAGNTSGVYLPGGGSAWSSISDSTKKRNIRLVDTKAMLEKVNAMPIQQWSYKSQDESIEHIGPMAQDFWREFHVGDDSLTISTIDPSGIALAAIQELAKQNLKLETRNLKLEEEVSALQVRNMSYEEQLNALMVRVQTLEAGERKAAK